MIVDRNYIFTLYSLGVGAVFRHFQQIEQERAARIFSNKLIMCEQRIKAAVRNSTVVGADETGLRVAGTGGRVHVAKTDQLTHLAYDGRRGKAAMDEIGILPQFSGTLVRDGYLSYTRFERCWHTLYNAHLLRDLVFIEETSSGQKAWTEPLAKLLLKIKEAPRQPGLRGQQCWIQVSRGPGPRATTGC
ncbi:MAG: transposase [Acidobacteriota bacterium]|jgi:hypothetical protein|nr:transposase [Acidobacteriota bacterium]